MKIDTTKLSQITALESARKKPAAKPAEELQRTTQPGKEAFSVKLSSAAEQAAAAGKIDDEARRAKVAAIRDQLASGSYSISGKDVATKILSALKG